MVPVVTIIVLHVVVKLKKKKSAPKALGLSYSEKDNRDWLRKIEFTESSLLMPCVQHAEIYLSDIQGLRFCENSNS